MMRNITIIPILSALLTNCNSKKQVCTKSDFEELYLKPVHVNVKIPPFRITDTTKYGPGRTILNYKIKSVDSLLTIAVFIDNYDDYTDEQLNIDRIALLQKQEVESGQNDKKLLTETIKKIDGIKVGYLKYLVKQSGDNFYSSRIFFYKDKKLIALWLFDKNVVESRSTYGSISDCIFESLKLF